MRFESEARIVRRGGTRSILSFVVGSAFVLFLAAQSEMRALLPIAAGLVFGGAALGLASRYQTRPGPTRHRVVGSAKGLEVDGQLFLAQALIAKVHRRKVQDGWAVHVDGRGLAPAMSIVLDDEARARELEDALEVGTGSAVARFRALPPWARHVRWLAVILTTSPWVLVNFLRLIPLWGWGFIVGLYGVIALPMLLPQRVEVGDDGILLRWLSNRRFIPFASISCVSSDREGAVLTLKSGKVVKIRLSYKADAAVDQRARLLDAIQSRLDAHVGLARAEEEALLARGHRDLPKWLEDMRALGAGTSTAAGYRTIAIPEDRLWEILENPSADPSAREGAALALHASLDEGGRDKLRALSRTTASPRLRVALDGVAKESDEAKLRIALDVAEREDAEPPSENLRAAMRK